MPAFEADFENNHTSSLKKIIKLQNRSIFEGKLSLCETLKDAGIDLFEYAAFFSLCNYYFEHKNQSFRAAKEEIYIHSKLIIADGTRCIIGSANLNDRSLLGDRDSEIAAIIEDQNENKVKNLLIELLNEHLGDNSKIFQQIADDVNSLCADKVFKEMRQIARCNTKIFEEVFGMIPNNEIKTIDQYQAYKNNKWLIHLNDATLIEKKLKQIEGHIVVFPYEFLNEEEFQTQIISKESLVSDSIYE